MVQFRMPRLGKKTLYLDLEALDSIEASLGRLPGGGPSLSSFLNEQLPVLARGLDQMVTHAEKGGLRGLSAMLAGGAEMISTMTDEVEAQLQDAISTSKHPDIPLSQLPQNVPPTKRGKAGPKKVVKT